MSSEKNEGEVLLETKIYKNEIYQIQQETLIVWTDPETDTELALSFQEANGCKEIWEQLTSIQRLTSDNNGTFFFFIIIIKLNSLFIHLFI